MALCVMHHHLYSADKATVFERLARSPQRRLCRVAGTLVLPPTYVIPGSVALSLHAAQERQGGATVDASSTHAAQVLNSNDSCLEVLPKSLSENSFRQDAAGPCGRPGCPSMPQAPQDIPARFMRMMSRMYFFVSRNMRPTKTTHPAVPGTTSCYV